MTSATPARPAIPSVDRLLRREDCGALIDMYGRTAVTAGLREVLDALRAAWSAMDTAGGANEPATGSTHEDSAIVARVAARLNEEAKPSLRPMFNLSGTVLHTNLGRAPLPPEAIAAVATVARGASNLEFDLQRGARGDRDDHLEALLCKLTGAEAATVVNNNAAAVLLVLNSLALRREVPVSRGELVEIGGSFRLPDIMARAGCKLREVGTTNRTHLRDFEEALGPKTGLVMKVHTSNYAVQGFTAAVAEADLAALCRARGVPFIVDLGSGTLLDLERYGLPHEPTVAEAIAAGADVVTFSGDKLLGGPQAGIVVGRAVLIAAIKRNPLKRALRVDKMTIAALAAVLRLYADPDRLAARLPTLRILTRSAAEVHLQAERLLAPFAAALTGHATVEVVACDSEVGSGTLPTSLIPSAGLAIRPAGAKRNAKHNKSGAVNGIAAAFRDLPLPVIGRIRDGVFILDLRCLVEEADEAALVAQLSELNSKTT